MKFNKQNIPLILAFAAPVIMIGITALAIYIPKLHNKPKYDFVYSIGSYYQRYSVDSAGQLYEINTDQYQPKTMPQSPPPFPPTQLYYYDTANGKSTLITLAEAKSYHLNGAAESPDGYSISHGGNTDLFPFGSSSNDYNNLYIHGHGINQKINLPAAASDYSYQFQLIGWVIK